MPTKFNYVALRMNGERIEGSIETENQADVYSFLQRDGLYPVSIKDAAGTGAQKEIKFKFNSKKKITSEDIYLSCKQFYTMLHSGISIIESLETVADQCKNKYFAKILLELSDKVSNGSSFSRGLHDYTDDLPSLYISMIETGEITGNLEIVMMRLADYYENDSKTAGQVKSAMIYPTVLLILTVVMVFFMMIFIMPTFAEMFESTGGELPKPTQVMINLSNFLVRYWWLILIIVAGSVFGFKKLMKIPKVQDGFDALQLKLPIVKFVVVTGVAFRVCRSLGIMLASGVSLYESLSIAAKVAGNKVGKAAVETCRDQIGEGMPFGTAVQRQPIFPSMMSAMIRIGEQSGVLDTILDDIADYYQEELSAAIRNLVAVMEPMMIIVMAVGIGSVVIAMLMPMFTMMEGI